MLMQKGFAGEIYEVSMLMLKRDASRTRFNCIFTGEEDANARKSNLRRTYSHRQKLA
jgi:hypothetical protein